MKRLTQLKILVLIALTGVTVAVTYFYFEYAVRHATVYVWDDLFKTQDTRWVLVPLCLVLTLVYFGAQHLFDAASEKTESHGLGSAPAPTVVNFIKVLSIGFLSLLAGASLGPEAILVPACMLLGSYVGIKLFKNDKPTASLFGMAGFIALFAAFFNSFVIGLLALALVKKQYKIKITPRLLVVAAVASASTIVTLKVLNGSAYVGLPSESGSLTLVNGLVLAGIGLAGFCTTYFLNVAHKAWLPMARFFKARQWWLRALVAGAGLSAIYLAGGPLVQFTGNESIAPMFKQSAELGLLGLVWILIIKVVAITWSKANGYRGGLIFPTVFVASVLVAIAGLYTTDLNIMFGVVIAIVGALVADSKVKFLT